MTPDRDPVPGPRLQEDAEIARLRAAIASIDGQIVRLIGERTRLAVEAAGWKRARAAAVRDPGQEGVVLLRAHDAALREGLDPDRIAQLFTILLDLSRDAQDRAAR